MSADGQQMVLDVRGWGTHQYEVIDGVKVYNEQRGTVIMDFIGDWIADAMNEKWFGENLRGTIDEARADMGKTDSPEAHEAGKLREYADILFNRQK